MDIYHTIVRPMVTEKGTHQSQQSHEATRTRPARGGAYTFEVHPDATKTDIKRAVEEIFGTRVTAVNLMNVTGKPRRVRLVRGKRRNWKKAIVTVEQGQTISFFEGV